MSDNEKELLNKFLIWMWDHDLTHIVERIDRKDVIEEFEKYNDRIILNDPEKDYGGFE